MTDTPVRFHQAVAFLPTSQILPMAKECDGLGYGGMYVSDHMFNPRQRTSRYTYSEDRGRRTGLGGPHAWPDPMCGDLGLRRRHRKPALHHRHLHRPAPRPHDGGQVRRHDRVPLGNRLRLGIGVGWSKEEFDLTGQDFGNRGKRLDEMIVALRALWAGGWVEFHGDFYDVPECQMEPAPTEPVPFICGGHSPVALRRTAELCDGWIAAGAYSEEEAWMHLAELHDALDKAGPRQGWVHRLSVTERAAQRRPLPPLRRRRRHRLRVRALDVRRHCAGDPRRQGAGGPPGPGALVRRGDRRQGLTTPDRGNDVHAGGGGRCGGGRRDAPTGPGDGRGDRARVGAISVQTQVVDPAARTITSLWAPRCADPVPARRNDQAIGLGGVRTGDRPRWSRPTGDRTTHSPRPRHPAPLGWSLAGSPREPCPPLRRSLRIR